MEVLNNHLGADNAITVAEIVAKIGEEQTGLTNPLARQMIRQIIEHEMIPVGSCANGYFIIQTDQELMSYLNNLHNRSMEIQERMKLLRKAWKYYNG